MQNTGLTISLNLRFAKEEANLLHPLSLFAGLQLWQQGDVCP